MHRSVYILVGAALLAGPSTAYAWTTIDGVADSMTAKLYRDWEGAAQIPTPHVTIGIEERDCNQPGEPGVMACLKRFTPGRMTLIYDDPTWLWREEDSPERIANRLMAQAVFYHELTHVRDYLPRRSHRYRDRFAQIMGWRPIADLTHSELERYEDEGMVGVYNGWGVCVYMPGGYCTAPDELFAMAGEWCSLNARNRTLDTWASGYGYAPSLAQHRAACALLAKPLS